MTTTLTRPTDDEMARAADLAADLGRVPTSNELRAALGVGRDVANRVRAELNHPATGHPDGTDAGHPPRRPVQLVIGMDGGIEDATDTGTPVPAGEGLTSNGPLVDLADHPQATTGHPEPEQQAAPDDNPEPAAVTDDAATDHPAADRADTDRAGHPQAGAGHLVRWLRRGLFVIALPAFVATWSGWVGVGELTGFGPVNLLPGFGNGLTVNSAITLPLGVEAYVALAMGAWLSGVPMAAGARKFAMLSSLISLSLGMGAQVAYHLIVAGGAAHAAPWGVTVVVSCLPNLVMGMAAALIHLLRKGDDQ